MKPRNTCRRPGRAIASGLVLGGLLTLLPAQARAAEQAPPAAEPQPEARTFPHAGNGRLLSSDEAAPIKHVTIGLQRTAVPLGLGIALDTSLLADALLAANVGVRWGLSAGPHRFVVGARYTQFLGATAISNAITQQEPAVTRFEPSFGGPSAYALYGVTLGSRLLVQAEVRHSRYQAVSTTATAAVVFNFAGRWSVLGELGVRLSEAGRPLRGAAGVRYGGEHLGFSLGVAYVDLVEPMLPVNDGKIPFLPAFDLSWTF